MKRAASLTVLLGLCIFSAALSAIAQSSPALPGSAAGYDPLAAPPATTPNAISQPTLSPGIILLMELDGRFSQEVAKGGGKAFASWFASDGVVLNNGKAPIRGHDAIAAQANWDPKVYQLTWAPIGGQMGPSNDMGFTWGHYDGTSKDKNGQPVVTSGRYLTVWKKMPDGKWKVVLDASAEEPPNAGDCCSLPKP